jgi:pyruvate ferredoxin oxidoreductase gamma subunit
MEYTSQKGGDEHMIEIRWHGRGGQGVVTASEILASALLDEGKYIQAFPEFGPERMGAPIRAFTRIDSKRIDIHSQIYEPDFVIVLDPTLLGPKIVDGLKEKGGLIVNSTEPRESVRKKTGFKGAIFVFDASKIAREIIGRDLTNTSMLGALVKVSKLTKIENVEKKLRESLGGKLSTAAIEGNIRAMRKSYEVVA